MSLKTPESRLRELGLGEYSIVYDDEESEPSGIAFLSKHGVELGHWNNDEEFVAEKHSTKGHALLDPLPLTNLTDVVRECRKRAGFTE